MGYDTQTIVAWVVIYIVISLASLLFLFETLPVEFRNVHFKRNAILASLFWWFVILVLVALWLSSKAKKKRSKLHDD